MDIKIYWYVLYDRNKITKSNKISQNTRNAPRHNFLNTYLNIYKCCMSFFPLSSHTFPVFNVVLHFMDHAFEFGIAK